jgi:hypothetical protein
MIARIKLSLTIKPSILEEYADEARPLRPAWP